MKKEKHGVYLYDLYAYIEFKIWWGISTLRIVIKITNSIQHLLCMHLLTYLAFIKDMA